MTRKSHELCVVSFCRRQNKGWWRCGLRDLRRSAAVPEGHSSSRCSMSTPILATKLYIPLPAAEGCVPPAPDQRLNEGWQSMVRRKLPSSPPPPALAKPHCSANGCKRWANVVAGTITTAVQLLSLFVGSSPTMYYTFFSIIEIAATAIIVWLAWKWRSPEGSAPNTVRLAG